MVLILALLLRLPVALAQDAGDDSEKDVGPVDLAGPTVQAPPPRLRWHLWLEPQVGLALPLGHPGLGSQASLGVGARPPWLRGRLLPGFRVGVSAWGLTDQLSVGLDEPYDWHLSVRRFTVAPLLEARLRPPKVTSPELGLGAELHVGSVTAGGAMGDADLGGTLEEGSWSGALVELGIAGPVGPGDGRITLEYHQEHLGAAATGDVSISSLVFALGWRVMP